MARVPRVHTSKILRRVRRGRLRDQSCRPRPLTSTPFALPSLKYHPSPAAAPRPCPWFSRIKARRRTWEIRGKVGLHTFAPAAKSVCTFSLTACASGQVDSSAQAIGASLVMMTGDNGASAAATKHREEGQDCEDVAVTESRGTGGHDQVCELLASPD